MPVSSFVQELLAARRDALNAALARVSRETGALDKDALRSFVENEFDPVARAMASIDPERAHVSCIALFEIGAGLVAQNIAGPAARAHRVNAAWRKIMPGFAPLLLRDTRTIASLITNSAANLGKWPELNDALWQTRLQSAAPHAATESDLRASLTIASWMSGFTLVRNTALASASQINPALCASLLDLNSPSEAQAAVQAMQADRWWSPRGKPSRIISAGAFTGFGGRLSQPPTAAPLQEGFLILSGTDRLHLSADPFGAMFHAAPDHAIAQPALKTPKDVLIDGAELCVGKTRIAHGLPPETVTMTLNADTIALTSPYAHCVRLYPLVAA